ncbi:MAG: response regulator transcription factor [Actinobacteria bacterium]|nr:MAG: response regulator transcription factor [Actinomycetota bacterium]TMM34061.1 MAG: response regulator transcription factor [Actinomycetota bacterium]
MSTPRRPAPRSRLAPIRAIGRPSACPRTQRKLPLLGMAVVERQEIRVLLADDDRVFLDALRELIDRQPELGVVGLAANGLEAIEQADELDPDAVVIDVHMPLLDGVTAVAHLRQHHPTLCVIALTGDEAPKLHEAVKEAGADGVLMKSELVDVLVERLAGLRPSG